MSETLDLSALRAVAQAATSGPWVFATDKGAPQYVQLYSTAEIDEYEADVLSADSSDVLVSEQNADFIEIFNPSTVLALLDRVERAERERDDALTSVELVARAIEQAADLLPEGGHRC